MSSRGSSMWPPAPKMDPPEDDAFLRDITYNMTCPEFQDSRWGFAIYRCTEGNDDGWNKILRRIRDNVDEYLRSYHRGDLLQYHDLHVIDDRSLYGATSHEVRDHFLQWVPNELRDRLKPNPPPAELFSVQNCFVNGAARYKFCLFVDDICLESLDQKGPNWPVVKVLEKNWGPLPADQRQYKIHPDYHDGETDEEEEEVGWMYMPADWYMDWYQLLTKEDDFYGFYARPPYISLGFPEDEVVGFWRDQPGN